MITNRGDDMRIIYPDFFYIPVDENEEDIEEDKAVDEFEYIDRQYFEEESEK